jgi:hypothetical protein
MQSSFQDGRYRRHLRHAPATIPAAAPTHAASSAGSSGTVQPVRQQYFGILKTAVVRLNTSRSRPRHRYDFSNDNGREAPVPYDSVARRVSQQLDVRVCTWMLVVMLHHTQLSLHGSL